MAFSIAMHCTGLAAAEPPTNLAERLRAICADNSRSYHMLLHKASHEARLAALGRPWSEVEPLLRLEGLKLIRSLPYTKCYRYLVTENGWSARDKTEHSLFVEFHIDDRKTDDVPSAKPGFVEIAVAGLLVKPNRPYTQVLAAGGYPQGSVLFRALRLPEVAAAAKTYPILKEFEVTYDFLRDRWALSRAQGFDITFAFADSTREERRGKSINIFAPSALDALQDYQGQPLEQQFKPQDTLGEFSYWGGREWKKEK